MSRVRVSVIAQRRADRAPRDSLLPSWSDTAPRRERPRPGPSVAAILRDLVSWACDIAIVVTRGCPEDSIAIDRVRRYAEAWLADQPCPDVDIDDVLTTVAAAMAGLDRDLGGTATDAERPGGAREERAR